MLVRFRSRIDRFRSRIDHFGHQVLNVVLVLQRFLSILASSCYFNAPPYPPPLMWAGSLLVVVGCVGYVLAPSPPREKALKSE
eukprot:3162560-Rhodomonas_salina.2